MHASPAPPQHKLLSRTVADWLASRIVSGELPPGERLHESRVAEDAQVSRSPVREALRLLAREGLVELVPRLGARVAHIGREDASNLYVSRLLVEPPCIRGAVEAMTDDDAAELNEIHERMESAVEHDDPQEFLEHNVRYYRRLISLCENAVLRELVELTWRQSLRYWSVLIRLPDYVSVSVERNRVLNDAVQARDAGAAEVAARGVLRRALDEIVDSFEHVQERKSEAGADHRSPGG